MCRVIVVVVYQLSVKFTSINYVKGTRNDDQNADDTFGEKFLGVKAGGSLEIHGPYKKSWTKLEGTLNPKEAVYTFDDTMAEVAPRGIVNDYFIEPDSLRLKVNDN